MLKLLIIVLAIILLAGCGQQETSRESEEEQSVEETTQEEQASIEETTEETTQRDIQTEGCPEGQIANAAGNECVDQSAKPDHSVRSATEIAAERADRAGLTPEQKEKHIAMVASKELNLAQAEPGATAVYDCLVDHGMLETTQGEQEAVMQKLIEEKGLYDVKAMTSDSFKELYGTDCGYMQLGDIRRS